jgi:hypothetical protein
MLADITPGLDLALHLSAADIVIVDATKQLSASKR